MQIYFVVTAEEYARAASSGRRFAYASYHMGPNSALLRQNLPLQTRGGLLCATDREPCVIEDPEALCAAFLRECGRRGYGGVLLDFERSPTADRRALISALSPRLRETGRALYLPTAYADNVPHAVYTINTAVSGGNFRTYLSEEVRRRGGGQHVALDVQRLRMDFRLPAPDGTGTPLSAAEFDDLREGKSVFFSPDLCARYFTCNRDGEAHFVLFDDADTLNRKLCVGASLGIGTAFLMWQEVEDLVEKLRFP